MRTRERFVSTCLAVVAVVAASHTWRPAVAHAISYPLDEIYVDATDGDDVTGTGTPVAPFKTISRGLEEAVAGDKVYVRTGLYDAEPFPIRMKEDVKLLGIPKLDASGRKIPMLGPDGKPYNMPIIKGGALMDVSGDFGTETKAVSIVGADYARFEHFVLYLSEIDGQKGIGILCDSTHPFIRYSTFKGYLGKLGRPAWAGIALYGSAQPIISGNVFESGELFRGVQVSGTSEPDIEDNTFGVNQGILVGPDAAATIRRNTITNPRPDPGASIGIVVQGSARVYANHIDHMQTGIYILGDGVTSVYDNVIEHNGGGSGSSAWWACGEGGVFIDGVTRVLQQTDLGGGGRSSGNNVFRDNEPYDVTNFSKHEIMALHNTWTHVSRSDIDRYDIYDDDESALFGAVSF